MIDDCEFDEAKPGRLIACALPSCKTKIQRPAVFCREHWQLLPAGLRELVGDLVAADREPDEIREAINAAIADLYQQEP